MNTGWFHVGSYKVIKSQTTRLETGPDKTKTKTKTRIKTKTKDRLILPSSIVFVCGSAGTNFFCCCKSFTRKVQYHVVKTINLHSMVSKTPCYSQQSHHPFFRVKPTHLGSNTMVKKHLITGQHTKHKIKENTQFCSVHNNWDRKSKTHGKAKRYDTTRHDTMRHDTQRQK